MAALSTVILFCCSVLVQPHYVREFETQVVPDTLLSEEYRFGSFTDASRLVLNAQGWIYVTDTGENTIFLFSSPRERARSAGGYGWAPASFDRPSGITTDGLSLYISDFNNHRIQRFDRNLNYLSSFSTRDTNFQAARFGFPSGVALSRFGDLFILDSENTRVLKFSRSLTFERSFGSIETKQGKLRKPTKLLVDTHNRVFVLEDDRLHEFDYFGNYLRTIGEGVLQHARGFDVDRNGIVVVSETALSWFSPDGRLRTVHRFSDIVTASPLGPVQDIALHGDLFYLLTSKNIVVMKTVSPQ